MTKNDAYLAGGLENEFYDFPYIGNVIIPTDELIFFRGVGMPPTKYCSCEFIIKALTMQTANHTFCIPYIYHMSITLW